MKIDLGQLEFIEPLLRKMAIEVEEKFGFEFTITSLYRIDDTGVHGQLPLRGLDLRCWDSKIGKAIVHYLNALYVYDPDRPLMQVCIFHDIGLGAHLHLQVHTKTRLR